MGHLKRDCPLNRGQQQQQQRRQQENNGGGQRDLLLPANTGVAQDKRDMWVLDSGAGDHVTNCKEDLSKFVDIKNGLVFQGAFGAQCAAEGYGRLHVISTVDGEEINLTIRNVWYVPGLGHRLLSVGSLDRVDCRALLKTMRSGLLRIQGRLCAERRGLQTSTT